MTLFIAMLPIYLLGNLHCLGMCGPLVMMISTHRFRYLYFLGRTIAFGLAGMLAGFGGAVLNAHLESYHLSATISILFGLGIAFIGLCMLQNREIPGLQTLSKFLQPISSSLSLLILQNRAWPTFLFGFFTVALPCGQTLLVFSACALYGDTWTGFLNGLAFALLTSPSLFFAMHAYSFLNRFKEQYNMWMGSFALIVGVLAGCRGFAEMDLIPHWVLSDHYHIVLF